ncbi:tRNA sulfurtransferase [Methanorbis rubei]|uniref:Probable tRNA sulfurtransferase n=1 Tax=Methanorbis rubei TaxID=3028300 RepID=A0AAE4MEP8_9EURY|nr:putative tRNA sulfurtransferase [Methanocorpusculaceae archaeon Cs1]
METNTAVMVRIGELWLKSEPVKKQFMTALMRNIRAALDAKDLAYQTEEYRGRVLIYGDAEKIAPEVARIFGIVDVSICTTCGNSPEEISSAAVTLAEKKLKAGMRFAVRARRQQVKGITSQELARIVADAVWEKIPDFVVDLDNPEYELFVEAREYGGIVYDDRIPGQGGLPLGTAGKAMLLLSAGIDSPVAAWLLMRRGVVLSGMFMDGGRWAGPATKNLALDNARILSTWSPGRNFPVWVVNMEPFFDAMSAACETHYTCIYCKRFMMRVADRLALKGKYDALASGENLGQVASQTIQNMGVITASVKTPILRPILTYDKEDTVAIARRIGTFHECPGDTGCRAVPKKPATRSDIDLIETQEAKLNLSDLIENAATTAELWIARDGNISQKIVDA